MENTFINNKSESFQNTFSNLINLSKLEIKRFCFFAVASIIFFCCAAFAIILTVFWGLQYTFDNPQQAIQSFALLSILLIIISLVLYRSAKISALRLNSVIEPASETFSLSSANNYQNIKDEFGTSSPENQKISEDRLPQVATDFYSKVDNIKHSLQGAIRDTFKPVIEVQSFIEKKPLLAVGLATLTGTLLSSLIFRRNSKNIKSQASNEKNTIPNPANQSNHPSPIYSAVSDLTLMAITFGIQTFIKQLATKQGNTNVGRKQESEQQFDSKNNGARVLHFAKRS